MPRESKIGARFGRLVVLRAAGFNKFRQPRVQCLCDCGNLTTVLWGSLLSGATQSCGCLATQRRREAQTKHGKWGSPEYRALEAAIARCRPRFKDHRNYFDRGIRVCPEWSSVKEGFLSFFRHVGPRPSPLHTLDRRDNNRGYEYGNVRWATRKEQAANSRPRKLLSNFSIKELLVELFRRRYEAP
jgi:hypothetical protein